MYPEICQWGKEGDFENSHCHTEKGKIVQTFKMLLI